MQITMVAADGHPIYLLGLKQLFSTQSNLELLACCSTAAKTWDMLQQHHPDILLLNLNLPDKDTLKFIRELKGNIDPLPKIVVLTEALDEQQTIEILQLGIQGVMLKTMPMHLLIKCLNKVAAGGQWLEKESLGHAFEKMLQREAGARRLATILTERETEVMGLVAQGLTNRKIAEKLVLSEGTVKIHVHNIYKKLGFSNRVDLTLYAQKKGVA